MKTTKSPSPRLPSKYYLPLQNLPPQKPSYLLSLISYPLSFILHTAQPVAVPPVPDGASAKKPQKTHKPFAFLTNYVYNEHETKISTFRYFAK